MIRVREYKTTDAETLWAIHFNTIRHINIRDYSQSQIEAWAPDTFNKAIWLKRMNELEPYIAVIDDVIVGYADLQPSGLIDHFFCHHLYQGQGVGKALMNRIFCAANRNNIKRLYSEVSITARPFYEHIGFHLVHQQEVEIRGETLINNVMEKLN